jgi:VWFA-related protein
MLLAAAWMSLAVPLRAQEQAQEPGIGGAFVDTLDVQGVNVEAVVTDRRGQRVTGLAAEDFRLLVDGVAVPLDYFAEVRDGRAVVASPDRPGAGPAALPPALTELGAGDEVGTNYLVFIDEFFSPYRLRNEALKVLARDLHTLGPHDRMAVLSFDGRRLSVIADWSAPAALEATLRQVARRKGFLTVTDLGGIHDLVPLEARGEFLMADTGLQPGDLEADRSGSVMAQRVIAAASGALHTLEPPTGRKVALVLSGGWKLDLRASVDRFDQVQEHTTRSAAPENLLRPLTDAANRLGYTVYPIHLADTLLPSAGDRTTQGPAAVSLARGAMAEAVRQGSLVFSAEETGGRLLRPGAPHLRRIAEDTRSYYWLGFTSTASDNRRRSLKVEVLRDGLEVRSRSSFVPLSRPVRAAMAVEGALLTGKSVPGSKPLIVQVGTPEERGPLTVAVPLALRLPAEAITLLPEEGLLVAHLEIWMSAIDPSGGRSEMALTPAVLALQETPEPGKQVVYRTSIVVRKGRQDVLLAATDTASGETFSGWIQLGL